MCSVAAFYGGRQCFYVGVVLSALSVCLHGHIDQLGTEQRPSRSPNTKAFRSNEVVDPERLDQSLDR